MNSESQKKNTQNIQRVKIFAFVFFFVFFLLPITTHAGTLFKNPNNLGLLGYWSFNEGTSTVVSDFSGNGNFGTTTNISHPATATSGWGLGRFGYAMKFDGVNDAVDIADSSSLNPTSQITISAWVKPTGVCSTSGYFVSKSNPGSYYLRFQGGGAGCMLRFQVITGAGTVTLDSATGVMVPGVWQYVVGTWDGANMRGYRNGVLVSGPTAQTGTIAANVSNIQIGNAAGVLPFNGLIDEVKIYSRALSVSEILAQYRGGLVTYRQPSNQGLIGYWSFNDGLGTTATDFSGYMRHGTMSGFASPATSLSGWGSGKFGSGLVFDGTDDVIDIDQPIYPTNTSWSFSGWVKATPPTSATIYSEGENGVNNRKIFIGRINNTKLRVTIQNTAGTTLLTASSAGDVFDGSWHHVVFSDNNGTAALYIDGVLDATNFNYTRSGTFAQNSSNIGCVQEISCNDKLTGKLDEIRLYNRALTASEAFSLYKTGERAINVSQNNKVKNGLVGLWSFNGPDIDWASNTAYDRAGANNGTLSGMSKNTSITVGKVGQALNFDGLSNLIDAGSDASIDDLGDMSVCAWVKPLASPPGFWAGLVAKSSGASTGWQFYIYGSSPPYGLGFYNTDGDQAEKDSIININEWQHVCGTWDGNAGVTGRKLYLNGTQVASPTLGTSSGPSSDASYSVTIGSLGSAPYLFTGEIDEVRLYSNVLSASDIKQLYNAGR